MAEIRTGTIIKDRYILKERKGSGSFGEVWRAHDRMIGKDVALKIYLTLDPAGVEEFKREYANTLDLSSPYLLTPHYFDVWECRPFLVMKYYERGSSAKLAGHITENELWKFVHDVTAGLDVLHSQQEPMVHQDIKPDNILVDGDGRFLITDFGISKRLRATMRKQSSHDVTSGAIPYMAPERFESTPMLSTASDVWSLGASIYELATGELPFSGFGGRMQLTKAEMPSLGSGFSSDLNTLMQRCLDQNLSQRPTVREVVAWVQAKSLPPKGTGERTQTETAHEPSHDNVPSEKEPVITAEYLKENTAIHGWLLFFLFIIAIGGLWSAFVSVAQYVRYHLYLDTTLLGLTMTFGCMLGALSFYTVAAFFMRKPNAVFLAKTYLCIVFFFNLLSFLGDSSDFSIIYSLAWTMIWFAFLFTSNQVREVIPPEYRKTTSKDKITVAAFLIIAAFLTIVVGTILSTL